MNLSILEQAKEIYEKYIQPVDFNEIEHVPDQFMPNEIAVEQKCICLTHSFFQKYYPPLIKELTKRTDEENHWMAEMLLVMNGENDKAWNLKKQLLSLNKLDVYRELRFNGAVCYKNKKSSSYYDYRLKLFQKIKEGTSKEELKELFIGQLKLVAKILGRFFRNYYCWMYRNKLLKLMYQVCGESVIEIEVGELHKFIQLNPNDYSAYSRLIAVVQNYGCKIEEQRKWIKGLRQFCELAFEKKESFTHVQTYERFLLKRQKELVKSQ